MLEIYEVLRGGKVIGIEIMINGSPYFIARGAPFFNDISAGKFPISDDGSEFERRELFSYEDW